MKPIEFDPPYNLHGAANVAQVASSMGKVVYDDISPLLFTIDPILRAAIKTQVRGTLEALIPDTIRLCTARELCDTFKFESKSGGLLSDESNTADCAPTPASTDTGHPELPGPWLSFNDDGASLKSPTLNPLPW